MHAVRPRREYRVVAYNTASASANKIHDDVVARRYGFRSGLVPGVDVYAYMSHPPVQVWGIDWLHHGSMRARFRAPVHDGEKLTVVSGEVARGSGFSADRALWLEVRNGAGVVCATGDARLPDTPEPPPGISWPATAPAAEPPEASPEVLTPGTALALAPHRFRADHAPDFLKDVRESLGLYAEARVAHPGWLLRDANYVLSTNVVLGPWIHVESAVQHYGLVNDGDMVQARATINKEWERKGHRFVELDVGLFADHRLVARVTHTAIYRPRPVEPQ